MNTLFLATAPVAATPAAETTSNSIFASNNSMSSFALDPFRILLDGIDRFDILNHPEKLLNTVEQLPLVWAGIFIVTGLIAVLNGYRFHRWIVLIIAFISGLEIGHLVSDSMEASLMIAGCVGVLMAVIAWPMMKFAVAACGGLAGAFIGANLWTALHYPPETHYSGALIGLVLFGMLSFMFYRIIIVTMTSVAGAFVLAIGTLTLAMHVNSWQNSMVDSFSSNTVLIPLLVLVLTVIGFVVQQSGPAFQKDSSGSKKPQNRPATA